MNRARVFISHEPLKLGEGGRPVPAFPLRHVRQFGELVVLVEWSELQDMSADQILWKMRDKLRDYSDRDFLLLVGSSRTFAPAIQVANEVNDGRCKVLTWNRGEGVYLVDSFDVNAQPVEVNS